MGFPIVGEVTFKLGCRGPWLIFPAELQFSIHGLLSRQRWIILLKLSSDER